MKEVLIPIVKLVTVRLTPVMMQRVVMSLHRPDTNTREKPLLALESGFHFLLENGGRIRLEREGTRLFPPRPPKVYPTLMLENGNRLLQEDGFKINLEHND